MKKVIMAIAAVILFILFLSTFIEKEKVDEDKSNNSIVMSVESFNYDLERESELNKDDENIICATCRGLVKLNSNNEVTLDLAKDLEVSGDGIEYKFTLKDDVCWSNGEKIKPEEIQIYFKSLIQRGNSRDIKALLKVYGVDKFREEKVDFEKYVAITSDDNTIKIRLNKRDDDFLTELSKPQYRVRRNISLWNDIRSNYDRIVYSGEYYISEVKDDLIKLKSNCNDVDTEVIMIKDDSKENSMASYEIGDRDIVVDVPISQVPRLEQNDRILSSPSGEGLYLAINSKKMDLDMRKEFVKILYKAAQEYNDKNSKSVKFSEGIYFEDEMDEVNKIQNRKVALNNSREGTIPDNINILISKEEVSEDFVKYLTDYFKQYYEINIKYEENSQDESINEEKFHMELLRLKENSSNKNNLFEGMKNIFEKENGQYSSNDINVEDKFFNSYIVVPVMFIDTNIAVSDKVKNVRIDGNGNVDFSGMN